MAGNLSREQMKWIYCIPTFGPPYTSININTLYLDNFKSNL